MEQLKVIEIFSSIEGEGVRAGRLCTFIRLAYCNLNCSYCDTKYSHMPDEITHMSIDDVLAQVKKHGNELVTLTGGEPLFAQKELVHELLAVLTYHGYKVNVETNGSMDVEPFRMEGVMFTIDFKSPSSEMSSYMYIPNFMYAKDTDVIKFVVGSVDDLEAAKRACEVFQFKASVYVSPIFGDIETQDIVQYMKENNLQDWTLQLQIHKYIWPVEMRGV